MKPARPAFPATCRRRPCQAAAVRLALPAVLALCAAHGPAAASGQAAAAYTPGAPPAAPPGDIPTPASERIWMQEIAPLAAAAGRAALEGRQGMRVEVVPGTLDPRLRLAPCQKVQPYLPAGQRAWGRMRIGLRCVEGPVAWNVTLPVTVKVYAPALVARQPLAAGTTLEASHLELAEVEWTASESSVLTAAQAAAGRTLARPLAPGQAVREADLRRRQWFAAGDPVRLRVVGEGFAIIGEGTALSTGLEGESVRVRTEGGRTVVGRAAGERLVELQL